MVVGQFAKYEGLGNDFVVVDGPVTRSEAIRLCDRRRGVGADGVLSVTDAEGFDARMRVINADGSVPEMCGNGIRCVALHLALARGLAGDHVLHIATDAGPRRCEISRDGTLARVRVDMGRVRFVEDKTLEVQGRKLTVAVVDAGNPHAVLFDDPTPLETIGPALATHPAFPAGTNVELAKVHSGAIDLVVWERGVGATLACGTGACATVVAAVHRGLLAAGRTRVSLPGGDLEVEPTPETTYMTGPARFVFRGELPEEVEPS